MNNPETETTTSTEVLGIEEPEMRNEYDFIRGERGRYAARYAQGTNLVSLSRCCRAAQKARSGVENH